MSNSYFQFKQFTIQQERCAMKVCTDACVLGAWAVNRVERSAIKNILDIGTGTGLLSLMLAQKTSAAIDAIEIDAGAVEQARENIAASPWAAQIEVFETSLQDIMPEKKYDLVICNPPFYENDLRSVDQYKNAAKHDTALTLAELVQHLKILLSDKGEGVVLLPFQRTLYFEELVKSNGMFLSEKLLLKQTPGHDHFRSIVAISRKQLDKIKTGELIIHDNERNYTNDFTALLKDYYLKL